MSRCHGGGSLHRGLLYYEFHHDLTQAVNSGQSRNSARIAKNNRTRGFQQLSDW